MKINMLHILRKMIITLFKPIVQAIVYEEIRIKGDPSRLKLSPKTLMTNTLFNTNSGSIEVGDYTFAGYNVSIITGNHSYRLFLEERMKSQESGRDIIIGKGVWIGSNAVILGPCKIGDHAVVAAGAVVPPHSKIAQGSIVAGIPAKLIRTIDIS
jgi:acetyltransferase-like isoleucine patch superfamily enzyme